MKIPLAVILFLFTLSVRATTYTAASLSPTDVQAAMNSASTGDTVVLPVGTNNWTSGVSWTAPANSVLMGAGTTNVGGGDKTVIIDDIASDTPAFAMSGGPYRMTGITVKNGTGVLKYSGIISLAGSSARFDHNHIIMDQDQRPMTVYCINGVIDHCVLDFIGLDAIYFYNGRHTNSDNGANYEWSLPTDFGGTNFFFIEDNIINGSTGSDTYSTRLLDAFTASKIVIRFNTLVSSCLYEVHATGHSGDDRGARAIEAYGNLVTSPLASYPNYTIFDCSSGCSLNWGNSFDQVAKGIFSFNVTRKNNATYNQAPTPSGWGYAGTNFNGTGSDWDGGTVSATSPWNGYPDIDQPGRGQGDLLINDFPSKVNSTTGTIHWPNQALEPIYIWANVGTYVNGWGRGYYNDSSDSAVAANRDYYPQASGIQTSPTSPFDGTSGTGWGTLANRPTTCTPGVAYFATDQGSWNTSTSNPYGVQQNGASGVLYKATGVNTWTAYYTPADYPSVYQGGTTNAPAGRGFYLFNPK